MANCNSISAELAQETFTDALRRLVGRGKEWSVAALSEATGIDERTINSYRTGETAPCLHKLLRIAAVLGPAFVTEVLAPAGLGGVERIGHAESDAQSVVRRLVGQTREILERLADGVFDHRDKAVTGVELVELAALLEEQGRAMRDEARPRKVAG